jgi:hypothetical protein
MGDGSGGKRTRKLGIDKKFAEFGLEEWYGPQVIKKVYKRLIGVSPEDQIHVSQPGFEP